MGKYTGAVIAENRQYEDPSDPANSNYKIVMEVTVPDAVIEPTTGKTLTTILAEKDTAINGKAAGSHNHDSRYYTESEMNTKLAGKSDTSHTHNYAGSSSAGGAATTALACTGNAATATALATGRTIRTNLASTSAPTFNGSANITPGVTGVLPVANGGTGNTTNNADTVDGYHASAFATASQLAALESRISALENMFLGNRQVGDVVKINENGTAINYIVVHKGLPSSMYDSSCDGVWLLREQAHSKMAWEADNKNDYENSDMKTWLNGTFLNTIDSEIREAIKTVKIPFKKGLGNASTPVQSGSNGLSCKVFLLSGYEVGFTTTDNANFPVDGAKLSYFLNGSSDANAKTKRICKDSSNSAVHWWLRSPNTYNDSFAVHVNKDGTCNNDNARYTGFAARPAFVLPSSLLVDGSGNVMA